MRAVAIKERQENRRTASWKGKDFLVTMLASAATLAPLEHPDADAADTPPTSNAALEDVSDLRLCFQRALDRAYRLGRTAGYNSRQSIEEVLGQLQSKNLVPAIDESSEESSSWWTTIKDYVRETNPLRWLMIAFYVLVIIWLLRLMAFCTFDFRFNDPAPAPPVAPSPPTTS